jgi:cell division protein ZapE
VVLDDNYDGKPAVATLTSLTATLPNISAGELLMGLTPPPEFRDARFETYRPDERFASQAEALKRAREFVAGRSGGFLGKKVSFPGVYLDGGFGVGKTHLLASMFHAWAGPKAFGSFLEFTSLVGYLGFKDASAELAKKSLICIDEFELDDPGDTMIMSRLLKELSAQGTRFAATSNTPPNALGEGRFAAADFKREIQGLGERFDIITVDGEDYRHRPIDAHAANLSSEQLQDWALARNASFDDFQALLKHLSKVHPTKFRKLLADAPAIALTGLYQLSDQVDALRFVSFIDRAYEQQKPIRTHGTVSATEIFDETMLGGGYRKKYLRAISRIGALSLL